MIKQRAEILQQAKRWFREVVAVNHGKNAQKLRHAKNLNINPFTATYLANFLTGNSQPQSIAKALIYPRVLGTSIATSFGANMQCFTTDVLSAFASTTAGIDIEFIDQKDGRKKYCQLKAGPTTINKDDVETIAGHFKSVIQLARANNLALQFDDMVVGVIYGEARALSANYKRITEQYHYPVYSGADFWTRLTGDEDFYHALIQAIASVALEANFSSELDAIIDELAQSEAIQQLSKLNTGHPDN